MKHTTAPLFEAVRRFVERDQAPFYSPGHKGGALRAAGTPISASDPAL